MGHRPTQEDEKRATEVCLALSGHDFSRAVEAHSRVGFSPCQGSRQGLKPRVIWPEVAGLKSCPDTKPGPTPEVHCRQNVFRPERTRISCTQHWTSPRVRLSVRERRMKCINAIKFHRKSGVA
jgi:hypothetical protein